MSKMIRARNGRAETSSTPHSVCRRSASVISLMSFAVVFFTLPLISCSSKPTEPPAPAWISQPSRTVDNGYIVYIGDSEASTQTRAQLQAEGIALEDLANECSMIPKGTRVEDRYHVKTKTGEHAYVKLAIEFQECSEASKTVDPSMIKQLANLPFTEQLKRYQDLEETGDMPDSTAVASVTPPTDTPAAPSRGSMSGTTHFYVVRQYVAYQKEIVVLSPPTAYQPASPETTHFITQVQPATTQVASYQAANPELKNNPQAWSKIPDRPHMERPQSLMAHSTREHEVRTPHVRGERQKGQNGNGSDQPRKKKRRRRNQF